MIIKRSWKLFKVGRLTKMFGGKRKISFNGLKAWLMLNTRGKAKNTPKTARIINIKTSPLKERFSLLPPINLFVFFILTS